MVFRNKKAHLPVAFEDGAKFHRLVPSSTVRGLWREKLKNKKIKKDDRQQSDWAGGGGPGDIFYKEILVTKEKKET